LQESQIHGPGPDLNMDISGNKHLLTYRTLLPICCAVSFGCFSGAYMRIPVLPLFARSLGADTFMVGIISSAFLLVAGLLCFPLGMMSDRLGRKRLILAGLLLSALTSLLLGFCKTPWHIFGVYLLSGAGIAAFAPTMMSLVSDFTPRTHLGRSYGWYTMALYGGMSLGPAMGGLVAEFLDFQWVFTISAASIFLMFWVSFFFLPGRPPAHAHAGPQRGNKAMLRELLVNRPLQACLLVTVGSCFGLGVFITFTPLHASDQGVGLGQIGVIFGTQAIVNALCRIPCGYLSDRVANRGNLVLVGLLGYSAAIAVLGVADSLSMFLIGAFAMGVTMGVAYTAIGALIAEVVPADSRGLAMGGYNTCIYLGMMLSALLMGIVISEVGFRAGFLITALLNAVCAFAFFVLFKAATGRKVALPVN